MRKSYCNRQYLPSVISACVPTEKSVSKKKKKRTSTMLTELCVVETPHWIILHNPDRKTKKIEFSVPDSRLRHFLTDIRVCNSYFESEEHGLLVINLVKSANKIAPFRSYKLRMATGYNIQGYNSLIN